MVAEINELTEECKNLTDTNRTECFNKLGSMLEEADRYNVSEAALANSRAAYREFQEEVCYEIAYLL